MHLEQRDSFPSPAEFKQTGVGTPANKLAQFGTNHCPAWGSRPTKHRKGGKKPCTYMKNLNVFQSDSEYLY